MNHLHTLVCNFYHVKDMYDLELFIPNTEN